MTIPSTATAATLSYWIRTDTAESGSTAYAAYKRRTVTIRFTMTEDSSLQTGFVVDDTALNVS